MNLYVPMANYQVKSGLPSRVITAKEIVRICCWKHSYNVERQNMPIYDSNRRLSQHKSNHLTIQIPQISLFLCQWTFFSLGIITFYQCHRSYFFFRGFGRWGFSWFSLYWCNNIPWPEANFGGKNVFNCIVHSPPWMEVGAGTQGRTWSQ